VDKKKNASKSKQVMRKVIANISMGNHDMINVFPEVMKTFDTTDIEMKRMCYRYLNTYALAKPDLALKLLAAVLEDAHSSSPLVCALALRNLSSIPIKEYLRESVRPLRSGMNSKDAFLRKTSLFGVARLYEKDPKMVLSEGLIQDVYHFLDDPNAGVVAAALTTLFDISEKGNDAPLRLTTRQALSITDLLPRSDEWAQTFILNSLMTFVPETHEDSMIVIDRVIAMLQHSNAAVVLNALKVLIYLINFVDVVEEYLTKKLASSMTSLLSKPPEIQFLALRNVILVILSKPKLIPFDVTIFFCEYNDPIYVKDTKLEIIYLLASESNLDIVLRELEEYGTDVDVQMSRKAIRALGNLAVKLDAAARPCVNVMLNLTTSGIDYVVQEAIITFKNVLRRYDTFNDLIPEIIQYADKVEEPEAKAALIWIVGQYSEQIHRADSILSDLVSTFKEDPYDVQLASLTACVKLFLRLPDKGEPLVIRILKWATEEVDHPDVRDRGFFYWRLLSSQDKYPGTAKEIIDGVIPHVSNENEQLDPAILEELELNIATLASIYLKPVGQVFRLAKRKSLPSSPARSIPTAATSVTTSRFRSSTVSSSTSDLSNTPSRHIDDYDVPAVNVKSMKKTLGLSRRLTLSKTSLSRKLSVRGFN
jgi:vesicle coat complex subunit